MGGLVAVALALIGLAADLAGLGFPVPRLNTQAPTVSPILSIPLTPAAPNETLLMIADFDDRSAGQFSGIDPAQRIYKLITEKLSRSDTKLRVEQYHQPVKDTAEARRVLKAYGATILIWGWYDRLGAEPNVELDRDKIALRNPTLPEFSLATPESFVIRFTEEIPAQSAYVTFFSLGMMQLNVGGMDRATAYMTQAIESTAVARSGAVNPWEALMWRGITYHWSGQYNLARADYSEALKLHPDSVLYLNRGSTYYAEGNYTAAIADFSKAIETDPKFKEAYLDRGNSYSAQGNNAAAIADYSKTIELDPTFEIAYFNRGIAYSAQGDNTAAITDYSKTIELNPKYKDAYFNRGNSYSAQGNNAPAIADYSKAIEIDPRFARAYTGRGNVYASWGKFNEAIADYQKSLSLNPDPYTYCVLGITYTKMGDFALAIDMLDQGVKLDTKSVYPWCQKALDNARQGTPTP